MNTFAESPFKINELLESTEWPEEEAITE